MYPTLINWPFPVSTYGFMVFLGIVASWAVLLRISSGEGIDRDGLRSLLLWGFVAGFLGARLLYAVVEWDDFLRTPAEILFSRSGFVFYGALLAGIPAVVWRAKRMGLGAWKVMDMAAVAVPLVYAFGRVGCFANGCCYGVECRSWPGILFPPGSPAGSAGVPVLPVQLISSAVSLVVFLLMYRLYMKKTREGQVLAGYLVLYGVTRFLLEIFRGDPRGSIGPFSTSQAISAAVVAAGITLMVKLKPR